MPFTEKFFLSERMNKFRIVLLSSALSCKHKLSLLKYYLVLNHLLYALNDVDDENGSKYVYKKLQTHAFGPICPQLNMNREEIQQSNIVLFIAISIKIVIKTCYTSAQQYSYKEMH